MAKTYTPRTGAACGCKRGVERDNCPACEGTGRAIDFAAIHARRLACPGCGNRRKETVNGVGPFCVTEGCAFCNVTGYRQATEWRR